MSSSCHHWPQKVPITALLGAGLAAALETGALADPAGWCAAFKAAAPTTLAGTQGVCDTIAPALAPADLALCKNGIAVVYWRYFQTNGDHAAMSCPGLARDFDYVQAQATADAANTANATVDTFYKIGIEDEGNQRFVAMTTDVGADQAERVGPVAYGWVLAKTAENVANNQPLLKMTLDGVDVGVNHPGGLLAALRALFNAGNFNLTKDEIGLRGDIEVVTGPLRNTAGNRALIAQAIAAVDNSLGTLQGCPAGGGATARAPLPPWIDGRWYADPDLRYLQAVPSTVMTADYNGRAPAAEWQVVDQAYPLANNRAYTFGYYGACQQPGEVEGFPGEIAGVGDSVQVNFGIRLRDYGSAAFTKLMGTSYAIRDAYGDGQDRLFYADVSTAQMITKCRNATDAFITASTSGADAGDLRLRANGDFRGILRAVCVSAVAQTYATNMAITGAGAGKDLYGWLPKFNFADTVRVLPAQDRADILAWYTRARSTALPDLFVAAMKAMNSFGPASEQETRPQNVDQEITTNTAVQVLGQWVPSFYEFAWWKYMFYTHTNVKSQLTDKLAAVFAPYRDVCRARYPDEASAAAYGSRVLSAQADRSCWWGPRPQAPVIYTDATNGVIVVVEARPTGSLLANSFHFGKSMALSNLDAAQIPVDPIPGTASQADLRSFWTEYNTLTSRQ
jgi:hypothetical protein